MRRGQLYTTGEIAVATGLSRQTLHAYARMGLIEPAETTPGGRRLFPARVVRRLDEIRAMNVDLTLSEIRDVYRGGRSR